MVLMNGKLFPVVVSLLKSGTFIIKGLRFFQPFIIYNSHLSYYSGLSPLIERCSFMKNYFIKYDEDHIETCLCCSKFSKCHMMFSSFRCFEINKEILSDFLNTYSFYFDELKTNTMIKDGLL